ncbi:folate-binding protein [Tardiphaga sp.]|uniref:CAF17-like 4Fe-4S cluster assembly/insertion protein YgfZ n=1 Tax=Tardiphaga sp. TaxID=1926292 RepID=UPI00260B7DFC|nr:folate-binding protein [Tardiphaga sp.]MDB5619513.1 folate-binding protein [Tardiphaga sp.]
MKAALLPDRGVVKLSGDDARGFLNNLVTSEIELVRPGTARFGALLTPQGKIVTDFLVTEASAGHGGGLLIELPRELAAPLATKLGFYKLRAKVVVENLSDSLGVLAVWDGEPALKPDLTYADPRDARLGYRILIPAELAAKTAAMIGADLVDEEAYEAHRIQTGVPRGGVDFAYGDAFPHESNMDRLAGVDFDKGCYVGQEVVSRMQHRGTARTRIVRVILDGDAPQPGSEIRAADKPVGKMGSSAAGQGLALIRTDRATDALDAQAAFLAGGSPIHFADPDALRALASKKTIA